jgi:RNA polymerase sigma-70 factor, ECF subfamily
MDGMVVQEQLLNKRAIPPAEEMTAATMTARLRAREPEQLVELFADDVWRFVSSQVSRREDAEDIVMEVFEIAIAKFQKLQAVDSQRHWLLSVARKKSIDCLRKQYRRAEQPISAAEMAAEAPAQEGRQEATREALKALPSHQSQALLLKYVNGLSTEEVSKVIGKSMEATNSLLQRARTALRAALTPVFPNEVNRES